MNENKTHYQLLIKKQVFLSAVVTAVLSAGLLFSLMQVGQKQTFQQRAQVVDNAPGPSNDAECAVATQTAGVPCDVANNFHCVNGQCVQQAAPPPPAAPYSAPETCIANGNSCDNVASCCSGYCDMSKNKPSGLCAAAPAGNSGQPTRTRTSPRGTMQGSPGGTNPVAGPVCSGTTKLSPEEARILNGMCPDIDPGNPGKNVCKEFCTAAENADSDKCKKPDPAKNQPGGIYHCETVNQNAGASMGKCEAGTNACQYGDAKGFCAESEGKCCKNPPPPPPPPPAPPAGGQPAPAVPRANPNPPGGTETAQAKCRRTCKAPNKCNSRGVCYKPAPPPPPPPPRTDCIPAGNSCDNVSPCCNKCVFDGTNMNAAGFESGMCR